MVEHFHKRRDVRVEHGTMNISEGLPHGVTAVIPLQVDFFTPGLDQAVKVGHTKCLFPLPRLKQEIFIAWTGQREQQPLKSLIDRFIYCDVSELPCFLFSDAEMFAWSKVTYLAHGDPEQIACSKVRVNTQGENGQVAQIVCK